MSGSLLEARRSGTLGLDVGEGMESLGRLALLGLRLAGVDDVLGPRSRREVRVDGRRVQVAEKFDFAYDQPQRGIRAESTPGSLVTGSASLQHRIHEHGSWRTWGIGDELRVPVQTP